MHLANNGVAAGINLREGSQETFVELIWRSMRSLDHWLQANGYAGYDPFDGLTSFLRPLTFGRCLAERILEQVILRCPFNLRPFLGIRRRSDLPPAKGHLARGYLRLFVATGQEQYKQKAIACLDWLKDNPSKGYSGHCWGLPFGHASRGGKVAAGLPYLPETSQICQAFLDALEILKDQTYLNTAASVCRFVLQDLPVEKTDRGSCISYQPGLQLSIHNANILGASILARTGVAIGDDRMLDLAQQAVKYTCSRQLSDGSWYYGEQEKYHWIDNFHTAFNLEALHCYIAYTGDKRYKPNLDRGVDYYCSTFFLEDGRPKYYHDRPYPIDIQCAAVAIDTLCYLSDTYSNTLDLARKVADWTVRNMQDASGYFYYRRLVWKTVKIPMVRWGQAPMLSALAHLLLKLRTPVCKAETR